MIPSSKKRRFRSICTALFEPMEPRQMFAAITVNSAGDDIAADGVVTLREAIVSADNNADVNADIASARVGSYLVGAANGGDHIGFNISGAGVHTINAISSFQTFEAVTIDGFTQPGASANTLAIGNNANYGIEINGAQAGSQTPGFHAFAGSITLRGLVINGFQGTDVALDPGTGGSVIEGCFIGTNVTGTTSAGTQPNVGIAILSSSSNTIGGTTPATRNLIGGHSGHAVFIAGADAFRNTVANNYI